MSVQEIVYIPAQLKCPEIKILDKGFIRFDNFMEGDLSVVNAARVSFKKRVEVMGLGDQNLIRFLMLQEHGSPFEHNAFRFHVKCPIFVAREWMRHRIASYNEQSGRYTEYDEDEFYMPRKEDLRKQIGKPGAYTFEPIQDEDTIQTILDEFWIVYNMAQEKYKYLMLKGLAKELARIILPVGMYTQFYVTINARSLMNFISLRNAPQAQYEIREYAKVVEEIFAKMMPITYKCFLEAGRRPP